MLQPAHVGISRCCARSSRRRRGGKLRSRARCRLAEASEFFEKLKRALVTGYFVEHDARTGRIDTVAVPGYVFWPDDRHSGMPPVGFGLFRALDGGYELWLAGLEFARRGDGHGRALLEALFATPSGQRTYVVRVQRASRYVPQVTHLLQSMRFTPVGDTARLRWFVRDDAPPALTARIREAVSARRAVN
jgi:ribosomal protein S18 acetylase RimI-like enzyme